MVSELDSALALAVQGFKVFPIAKGAKAPPLVSGWPAKATADPAQVDVWWAATPAANIGIHCEGLVVIDVDVDKGGAISLAYLDMAEGIPATLTTRTPSGGRHLFYRLPEGHPGVPNSVSTLGAGLDVRSTNGYVVAPGSETPAGVYRWENPDQVIADAPLWLVQKLGTIMPKERTPAAPVPDADPGAVQRAADWLAQQEPATQGAGGDARTYEVACGLRDQGVSREQAVELLLTYWNDRCSPPWTPDEIGIKADNAYQYATGEPGAKAALATDFPEVAVSPISDDFTVSASGDADRAPLSGKPISKLQSLADFATPGPSSGYVIKGLFLRRSYAEAFGAPGEGKTFVMLDAAYHVAAGKPWMGRKVHAGPVLYLAYEGTGGLKKRAQALRQHYGTDDVPLYIVGADFNLRDAGGRKALGELLAQLPSPPVLIVIDTFARALMGGDENSAQDVGAFNQGVGALIEATKACVTIIHHSGKDKSKGARGSSALFGAIDTEVQIDEGRITATKQRDVEAGEPIGFQLKPVIVGVDEDGDEISSCVVEQAQVASGVLPHLTGNAKRGFETLCQIRPTNEPVTAGEWREACKEFLGDKATNQRFFDLKKGLLTKGYIMVDNDGTVTRRLK